MLKEGCIREDQLTSLELGRVGREQVLHQPVEFVSLDHRRMVLNVCLDWIDRFLHLRMGRAGKLEFTCSAILFLRAKEFANGSMHFNQLVSVRIVRCIDLWWPSIGCLSGGTPSD